MGTCHVSSAIKPGRKLILIVGLVWGMAGWALLAPVAVADPFTATFNLGSINARDFRTGLFNYGFSPLGFDPSVIGQVTIDKISVSTDAVVNGTLTGSTSFDWELFVGPSPFVFTPPETAGQKNGTSVVPETITSSAPTQFRFAQVGVTETLTGSYDFTTNAFVTNTGNFLKFAGTSPGDFTGGLYAQAFMWTEAGANLTFNNITMTVSGNVVPEPSSILLLAAGVLSIVFVLRKH
jgi:hypothetical protein